MKILFFLFYMFISTNFYSQNQNVSKAILKAKSKKIVNALKKEGEITPILYDSLIDLNYDKIKDLIIGYYGKSGTGIKNKVRVYIYDKKKQNYVLNEDLSSLSNPTFYINQKKITEFYIGNGGGSGTKLEWINGKWTPTKLFEVDNDGSKTVWKISYPLKKKKEDLIRAYEMIPPKDILETNVE